MDLPNTRLWRDDPRPMASSPRTVSLSRFRSPASRRRLGRDDRSAPAFRRAPITGAQNRKSALTENAPYKACSGFTHVTARRISQPPKAAFVTRLQPFRLPSRAARQLPDQSTTLWVESSSTSDPRLRGALPKLDISANSIFEPRQADSYLVLSIFVTVN
jgi:hypothetical protein